MSIVWHWPQITWVVLVGLRIAIHAAKEGEEYDGKYSSGISLICAGISAWILYSGGFFLGVNP